MYCNYLTAQRTLITSLLQIIELESEFLKVFSKRVELDLRVMIRALESKVDCARFVMQENQKWKI